MKDSRCMTMLELVEMVQDNTGSDEEAVALIAHMIKTKRLVLSDGIVQKRLAAALAT